MNYSAQREAILTLMQSGRLDHPTADAVFAQMRRRHPRISLATVYRNLNLLAENGDILKIEAHGGPERFDHQTHAHAHAVCKICGMTADFSAQYVNFRLTAIARATGFKIDSAQTVLRGICGACAEKSS